jgi:hypothetical protein
VCFGALHTGHEQAELVDLGFFGRHDRHRAALVHHRDAVTQRENFVERFRYFGNPLSDSTTIEIKGLVHPALMIEIEVVAMV